MVSPDCRRCHVVDRLERWNKHHRLTTHYIQEHIARSWSVLTDCREFLRCDGSSRLSVMKIWVFISGLFQKPKKLNKFKGALWGTLSGFTSFISHAGGPPFQIFVQPQQITQNGVRRHHTLVLAAVNLAKVIPYSATYPYTASLLLK